MKFVNNKNNLPELKNALDGAKKQIYICSAWISNILEKLFDDEWFKKHKKIPPDIKILLRLGETSDLNFSDINTILDISEQLHAEIKFTRHLHAKVNIIDGTFATVGSFNLTKGGYGDKENEGRNEEIGVIIKDKNKIKELEKEFLEIWDNAYSLDENFSTLGVTINNGNNRVVDYIAFKEIESGKFVEIQAEDYNGKLHKWLGQVTEPIAYNTIFFDRMDSEIAQDERFKDIISALTEKKPVVRNIKLDLTVHSLGYSHLRYGHIKILKEIVRNDKGQIQTLAFNRIPIPAGAYITKAKEDVLKGIFPAQGKPIAKLVSDPEVKISMNYEEILSKHLSIFGATGSGKSYFTKRFIEGFYNWKEQNKSHKKCRIIIIDTHNEYVKNNKEWSKDIREVIKEINLKDDVVKKMNGEIIDENTDYSKWKEYGLPLKSDEIKILKDAYKETESKKDKEKAFLDYIKQFTTDRIRDKELTEIIRRIAKEKLEEAPGKENEGKNKDVNEAMIDTTIANKLFFSKDIGSKAELKDFLEKSVADFKENYPKDYEKYKDNLIENILKILANGEDFSPAFPKESYNRIERLIKEKEIGFKEEKDFIGNLLKSSKMIYVVNTDDLGMEETRKHLGTFLNMVLDRGKEKDFEALIVVEEAQNFAPEKESKDSSSKALMKIASEGRKFNIGLIVITQRPAYTRKDVLAQCNTSAIFRLINNNDIDAIERSVEAVSESLLKELPEYPCGQCIFTGVGIGYPVTVNILELKN